MTDFMRDLADTSGFEIEGHWLELYGRCATCRDRAATGAPA
jgi:Fe2+ or Zn2+ uptake regulation protein